MHNNASAVSNLPSQIVIFDLDGCLFDDTWRLGRIHRPSPAVAIDGSNYGPYDWYHEGLLDDGLIDHSAAYLRNAIAEEHGIVFATARPENVRDQTVGKLEYHFKFKFEPILLMRPENKELQTSPDLKMDILRDVFDHLSPIQQIVSAYDDRKDVCEAYLNSGYIGTVKWLDKDGIKTFTKTDCSNAKVKSPKLTERQESEKQTAIDLENAIAATASYSAASDSKIQNPTNVIVNTQSGLTADYLDKIIHGATPQSLPVAPPAMANTVANQERTAGDILLEAGKTFKERNLVYKDNAEKVGLVMECLFPDGVQLKTAADHKMYHLFELLVVKLTRFTNSGLTHQDSIHDLAVYAAMCENLVGTHNINFEGTK